MDYEDEPTAHLLAYFQREYGQGFLQSASGCRTHPLWLDAFDLGAIWALILSSILVGACMTAALAALVWWLTHA